MGDQSISGQTVTTGQQLEDAAGAYSDAGAAYTKTVVRHQRVCEMLDGATAQINTATSNLDDISSVSDDIDPVVIEDVRQRIDDTLRNLIGAKEKLEQVTCDLTTIQKEVEHVNGVVNTQNKQAGGAIVTAALATWSEMLAQAKANYKTLVGLYAANDDCSRDAARIIKRAEAVENELKKAVEHVQAAVSGAGEALQAMNKQLPNTGELQTAIARLNSFEPGSGHKIHHVPLGDLAARLRNFLDVMQKMSWIGDKDGLGARIDIAHSAAKKAADSIKLVCNK